MAHAGEEVRLVPARRFELPAFLRDLAEQPRILDRERGLRGERLQQFDDLRRERPRRLPVDQQPAEQVVLAQQRHREERTISGADE